MRRVYSLTTFFFSGGKMSLTTSTKFSDNLAPNLENPFYTLLYQLLDEQKSVDEVVPKLLGFLSNESIDDPLQHLEGYRMLLSLLLIREFRQKNKEMFSEIVSIFFEKLRDVATWKEFQLLTAYQTLCLQLDGRACDNPVNPHQEESYAPIEYGNHWTWANIPLQHFHLEMGLIWALLGIDTNGRKLIDAAYKVVQFQLNLLDNEYCPLQGVFTQEQDASIANLMGWSVTLFHCVGHSYHKPELLSVAKSQLESLNNFSLKVHPLLPLILKWKPYGKNLSYSRKPPLPTSINDHPLAMVGKRSERLISISTLYGGRTGLGTYQVNKNLSIVTFGPQYPPYGDCQGFGVESSSRSQNKFPSVTTEQTKNGYRLKGYTKLVGENAYSSPYAVVGNSSHSEVWLDVQQGLVEEDLNLQVNYLSYEKDLSLSFVFYVRAFQCAINENQMLHPKSLDRYQGAVESLIFTHESENISIIPQFKEGVMEVIPLAGDESFWGCDFLVGFTVSKDILRHHWQINHSTLC
jgi:hypothetical protein